MADNTFKLELEQKSTFNKNYPNLNQSELEAKYKELWLKHQSTKGSPRTKWETFQKKHGVLLAGDTTKANWGNGKPLFKVRFTKQNEITTSSAVGSQVRAWRSKFLTEGSPGTKLRLEDTGKQFYDSKTGHALQIHHEKGISEYGPFIDESIRKLIPGNSSKVLKEGIKEYNTFKKWAYQSGRIFGDKTENYTALLRNQHINIPGSVHWLRSKEGPFYSVKASGGTAFDSENLPVRKLKAQTGTSLTPTQDLLNKADRTTFTKNYDITKPGSIWDEMGSWYDLTDKSTKDATAAARQIANPTDAPNKIPKIDEARIQSTNIKDQIPVIKKIAAQYEANEGLHPIDAINKAKIEYNRIRYGDTLARGFDVRKLGLLSKGLLTSGAATVINTGKSLAGVVVDPRDLLNPEITTNVAQAQNRIEAGEDHLTVIKEEGLESAGVIKDELMAAGGAITALKAASAIPKAGTVVKGGTALLTAPVAMKGLLAAAAYNGVNAYVKERTGRSVNERLIMDTGYADFFHTERVVNQELDDEGNLQEVVTYEKDPEIEKKKWDNMRTYFENRNK